MSIDQLRFGEIHVFIELARVGSLRQVARQSGMSPGQISKTLRGIEQKLGRSLMERSSRGLTLTAQGMEVLPILENLHSESERLTELSSRKSVRTLSLGTTSFLSVHLVPRLLGRLARRDPSITCQLLDLAPQQILPVAHRGGIELCLHMNEIDWPRTWVSEEVGRIRWVLVARRGHPLQELTSLDQVMKQAFVTPVYWTPEGKRFGSDQFPIPIKKRVRGFETTTVISAVQIVAQTDHLAFVPEMVAGPMIKSKALKILSVPSLKPVLQPVYLAAKSDLIKQKQYLWLKEQCAELLSK